MSSSSLFQKRQAQGWLKKKGKKRYFVIENFILYWFNKEQKNVAIQHSAINGCLELKGCHVVVEKKPKFAFTIRNAKEGVSYTLIAANSAELNSWVDIVKELINSSESTDSTSGGEGKSGILSKKGKKRNFVLQKDCLIWYLPDAGKKKAKGSLPLAGATIGHGSKPTSIMITPKVGKVYEVFGSTPKDAKEWREALQSVVDSLQGAGAALKKGWLEKKGAKRWFEVREGRLLWFNAPTKTDFEEPNGYLMLPMCTIRPLKEKGGRRPFRLDHTDPKHKPYVLTADSSQDCADWVNACIDAGCEGSKIDDPNAIVLGADIDELEEFDDGDADHPVSIRRSGGRHMSFANVAPHDVEKSGWVTKKGKRRWLKLEKGVLSWHDKPKSSPNFTLDANFSTVVFMGALANMYYGFDVRDNRTSKEYLMEVPSDTEAMGWIKAMVAAGANEAEKEDVVKDKRVLNASTSGKRQMTVSTKGSDNLFKDADHHGWLEKKGKMRWFMLRNRKLEWYSAVLDKASMKPNGSLDAGELAVALTPLKKGTKVAIVITRADDKAKDYTVVAEDEDDAQAWMDALITAGALKGTATKASEGGASQGIFGQSLQDVISRDKETGLSTPECEELGLPFVVHFCAEFIRNHSEGMSSEGIFRLSGDANEVSRVKKAFDEGRSPGLPPESSVHTVTGTLKAFFRELEPPLVPYTHYSAFLRAADNVAELQNQISLLPPENAKVMHYMLDFLAECASYSHISHMAPMNLAIVMAPNWLRTENPLMGLTDAARVGQCVQALIQMAVVLREQGKSLVDQGSGATKPSKGHVTIAPGSAPANSRNALFQSGDMSAIASAAMAKRLSGDFSSAAVQKRLSGGGGGGAPRRTPPNLPPGGPPVSKSIRRRTVEAMYDFAGEKPGDLSFRKGTVIELISDGGSWWEGCIGDVVGKFPHNYVRTVGDDQEIPADGGAVQGGDESTDHSGGEDQKEGAHQDAKIDDASGAEDGAQVGDSSVGTHEESKGEDVVERHEAAEVQTGAEAGDVAAEEAAATPVVDVNAAIVARCEGLYDFRGDQAGDLSFNKGDVILVSDNSGTWWTGTAPSGAQGRFPKNYVKVLDDEESEPVGIDGATQGGGEEEKVEEGVAKEVEEVVAEKVEEKSAVVVDEGPQEPSSSAAPLAAEEKKKPPSILGRLGAPPPIPTEEEEEKLEKVDQGDGASGAAEKKDPPAAGLPGRGAALGRGGRGGGPRGGRGRGRGGMRGMRGSGERPTRGHGSLRGSRGGPRGSARGLRASGRGGSGRGGRGVDPRNPNRRSFGPRGGARGAFRGRGGGRGGGSSTADVTSMVKSVQADIASSSMKNEASADKKAPDWRKRPRRKPGENSS